MDPPSSLLLLFFTSSSATDSEGEVFREKKKVKKSCPAPKIDTTVNLPMVTYKFRPISLPHSLPTPAAITIDFVAPSSPEDLQKSSLDENVTIPSKDVTATVIESVSASLKDSTALVSEIATAPSKEIVTPSMDITISTPPLTKITSSSFENTSADEGALEGADYGAKLLLEIINSSCSSNDDPSRSRVCDALSKLLCESSPDKSTRNEIFSQLDPSVNLAFERLESRLRMVQIEGFSESINTIR
ncbi:hypothetical protein C5167_026862 [Papaver somniferum]|nr:hypothetical protein C5167_026862 [Papaver somniferum]